MRDRLPLARLFDDYLARNPAEAEVVALFRALLAEEGPVFERARLDGHFTGSAWVVSTDGQRVLLMHHRKLGRWLQLGGHADGDADLAQGIDQRRHIALGEEVANTMLHQQLADEFSVHVKI